MIYAHRGARLRAAENTIEAFALALEISADALETDAHMTRDSPRRPLPTRRASTARA